MAFSQNMTKFAYGGSTKIFYVYELVNGTYQEQFSYQIGSTIKSVRIDES